tara:strand:+ start:1067 stop:1585 length:519 start_codon:yes stop_codon:yes gene_type:complete
MTLYIQVDTDNKPLNHPVYESNLRLVYPSHDFTGGPPNGWVEFERIKPPELGVYQKFDDTVGADIAMAFNHNGLEYKLVNGKFKDVWHVLELTDAEKKAKQDAVKVDYADGKYPASWVFNETICDYEAPVAYPNDGKMYAWKESTTEWIEYPSDGKNYEWDTPNQSWKEITE